MSQSSDKYWRPATLDECADFWRLHHWVRQHPGQWTLEQVYKRMLAINEGPPVAADLATSARLSGDWLRGIGFLRLAERNGDLTLDHDQDYLTALIGLEPGLQLPLMRADEELRGELVWGMLRQEGNRGVSLSASDRAGWYSRTLRLLSPTIDEADSRQAVLCALLSSPIGPTVTLAVGQLASLSRAGRLDVGLFARSCEAALMGSKANALRVLAILRDNFGAAEPASLEPLLSVALSFPHAQVQRAALDLARDCVTGGLLTRVSVAAVVDQADLDPLVAPTARDLLADTALDQPGPGLVLKEESAQEGPAAFLPPREVAALQPMSADDVSGRVGVLAEKALLGLDYELALAFLTSPEFDPSAVESLRPLVRRLTTRRFGHERMLGMLLQMALDGGEDDAQNPLASAEPWRASEDMPALMRERITEVAGLLARGQRYRLLATPTDERGAVDPLVLVRRALDNGDAPPLPADLTQALLRVDTDHPDCAAALALLDERGDDLPAARRLRLALSGAVRARAESFLSSLAIKWEGRPAYDSRTGAPRCARDGSPVYAFYVPRVIGADTGATGPELSALADITSASGDFWAHRYIYPASVRHFAVCLLASQWYVLDTTQLMWDCYRALADHGGRWDALSAQLLALAMGEQAVEVRALGVETLASLVARGDLGFDEAVEAFVSVAPTVKLNRWAQAFADLGDLDPRLALDLALAVAPVLEPGRTGVGKVLATMTAQYQRAATEGWAPPLDEGTLMWLSRFKGSSQAARYARALKEKNT